MPLDFMNREIKIGCTLVYPVRRGADLYLRSMIVESIEMIRAATPVYRIHGRNDNGRPATLEHPNRCVIV